MCEKAAIKDPRIVRLRRNIVSSQQAEIDEMKAMLADGPPRARAAPAKTSGSR